MQLKGSAFDWLVSLGADDAELETTALAPLKYRFDVTSKKRRIAIECGATSPKKLVHIAGHGGLAIWMPHNWFGAYGIGDRAGAILICAPEIRAGRELDSGRTPDELAQKLLFRHRRANREHVETVMGGPSAFRFL